MEFQVYAFADYSGATSLALQRKSIVLAKREMCKNGIRDEATHFSREELLFAVQKLLQDSSDKGKRVICGFDHNYSFPAGFYDAFMGEEWTGWDQLLNLLSGRTERLPFVLEGAREWAEKCNWGIRERLKIETGGPFWGPHFVQASNPKFPFLETGMQERRLVEERCLSMKPVYKIGGAGSVGLQSLYGIAYLAKLRESCVLRGIPLFIWPFDGWEWPDTGHVLVEVYPSLYNHGKRTDVEDARSCVEWVAKQDREDQLRRWMQVDLSDEERKCASLEGWVLGVL